jgi:hypothetical protein
VVALEDELRQWDADPERVCQLSGWSWIMNTLNQLPGPEVYMA